MKHCSLSALRPTSCLCLICKWIDTRLSHLTFDCWRISVLACRHQVVYCPVRTYDRTLVLAGTRPIAREISDQDRISLPIARFGQHFARPEAETSFPIGGSL